MVLEPTSETRLAHKLRILTDVLIPLPIHLVEINGAAARHGAFATTGVSTSVTAHLAPLVSLTGEHVLILLGRRQLRILPLAEALATATLELFIGGGCSTRCLLVVIYTIVLVTGCNFTISLL